MGMLKKLPKWITAGAAASISREVVTAAMAKFGLVGVIGPFFVAIIGSGAAWFFGVSWPWVVFSGFVVLAIALVVIVRIAYANRPEVEKADSDRLVELHDEGRQFSAQPTPRNREDEFHWKNGVGLWNSDVEKLLEDKFPRAEYVSYRSITIDFGTHQSEQIIRTNLDARLNKLRRVMMRYVT